MKFFIKCCLLLTTVFLFSQKTQAQAIITVDTIIDATCNTSSDGAILISVAGTPPFTYQWSSGQAIEDLTGLDPGDYTLIVTDANGVSTHAEYDDFGRLQYLRDQDGNILEKTDYHYKNQ